MVKTLHDMVVEDVAFPIDRRRQIRRVKIDLGQWSFAENTPRHDPEYLNLMAALYTRLGIDRHTANLEWEERAGQPRLLILNWQEPILRG